jgi:putative peptide modification system cyclase
VLLAGLGIGAWFLGKPQPAIAFAERDWVVVGDLRNLTGEKVLDDSLQQAFRISLEQSRHVNLLSDMKARDTLARMQRQPGTLLDRAVASEIALRDGARAVILPTVSEVGGRVRFSAEVIDPNTQTTVYAESADGVGVGSALDSIDKVTGILRGKLGEALASVEKDSAPLPQVSTKNLDALRAYALGQKAFGKSQYAEAKSMYGHAVELDDSFALAYIGLLRSHNAMVDLAGGVANLRKAVGLRSRLPARDQLYVDAWIAEVDAPPRALEKWLQMASLYPDFFPASANVGYRLLARNKFPEGMTYATQATSKQYELSALSWDLVGQLALAQEKYPEAEKAFRNALAMGASMSVVRLADTFAAQRRFSDADLTWSGGKGIGPEYFDAVTRHLDQGQWDPAARKAHEIGSALQPGSLRARAAFYPVAVADWMRGDGKASLHALDEMTEQTFAAIEDHANNADAQDDAIAMVSAGILAQRMGDKVIAEKIARRMEQHQALLNTPPLKALFVVLKANDALLSGDAPAAEKLLLPIIDGSEPFQAHVALLEAYAATSQQQKAMAEVRWLTRSRGRAYAEPGCAWCQQPLNVVDTTLAHLRAAELLASAGQVETARRELGLFDKNWNSEKLPDHLRVRRESAIGMFK